MFKKPIWKPLLIGLGWITCLAGLVVLMSFIEVKKSEVVCKAVKVFIPGNQYFIDRQEIDNILEMSSHSLVGRRIDNIDIHELENKLKVNPFIEFAKVYVDMDGVIEVEVSQRKPILRVMNRFDQDFYIDQHGLKMPLSQNFTARVLVANGFIDELFANKVDSLHTVLARDIYKTADFIRKDSLWDAQIEQIFINKDHEIELIPRVGNQRILLGNADSLALKFDNLRQFYKQALPLVGWDAYKLINIKYSNQVVGVKNESLQDSLNNIEKHKAAAKDSAALAAAIAARPRADEVIKAAISDEVERTEEKKPEVVKPKPAVLNKPKEVKQLSKPAATEKKAEKPATAKPAITKTEKKTSIKKV
jgi:cell division protein FtsQ